MLTIEDTSSYIDFLDPIEKLERDVVRRLKATGNVPTRDEARYIVDAYYMMQKQRIAMSNRLAALAAVGGAADDEELTEEEGVETNEALQFLFAQFSALERQVQKLMQIYVDVHPMAWFFDQTLGVSGVLAAGLLAYIDIHRAPTVGHIWNFAGLNPRQRWLSRDKATHVFREHKTPNAESPLETLMLCADAVGRNPKGLAALATRYAKDDEVRAEHCIKALSTKPFSTQLKTLCWKIGCSFQKLSGNPESFYGRLYLEYKTDEIKRNEAGEFAEQAERKLKEYNIGKATTAYKCYAEGILPPAHIIARAKRKTVKIFLSHLHQRWHEQEIGPCPQPYAIEHLGHAHMIEPPQKPPV